MSLLQRAIEATVAPQVTHRTPIGSLHISIFQFAWARETDDARKQSAWRTCQDDVIRELERAVSPTAPILLKAAKLEVRPAAIIVVFSPSPELEALRNRISGMPSISSLRSRRPGLQHVSLFRYSTEMALDELRVACQNVPLNLPPWHVANAELVQETVYPSLGFESLRSFEFADVSVSQDSDRAKRQ